MHSFRPGFCKDLNFVLIESVHRRRQRVIIGIDFAADGTLNSDVDKSLTVADGHVSNTPVTMVHQCPAEQVFPRP